MRFRPSARIGSAAMAAVLAAAVCTGCSFPEVSFSEAPDGSGLTGAIVDAGAPDVTLVNEDDGETADGMATEASSELDGGADAACNFNGVWGSRITIDVNWTPQGLNGFILASGSGQIKQWVKGLRVQSGTALADTSVVCGIQLPDFQETLPAGGETYGITFPTKLFDNGYLPTFVVNGALSGLFPGATYGTTTTAVLLGLSMANPTSDPWPATVTTEVDMDQDGKPGVTVGVNQGGVYSNIPTAVPPPFLQPARANAIYLAIRQVTIVTGTVEDCDDMMGSVQIPQINSKAAIDSHILGCALADGGGDCTMGASSQASFVDNTQPIFAPTGTTDFHSTRMKTGTATTCADIVNALP